MWDRQTETWWQQFEGKGIVGELAGADLEYIPSMVISLEDFFKRYPDGLVLSKENGNTDASDRYGINPYTHYDAMENDQPRLFFENVDSRLPAMERIINVSSQGHVKIYPLTLIQQEGVIHDSFEGEELVFFHRYGTLSVLDETRIEDSRDIGSVTVFYNRVNGDPLHFYPTNEGFKDRETGSLWDISGRCISGKLEGASLTTKYHGIHFAFAWFSFFPESDIYSGLKE
jgi:hypothetical protein